MNQLKDIRELEKLENGNWKFVNHYEVEMTPDECLKYKTNAEKNIVVINKELEKHTEEHIQETLQHIYTNIDTEAAFKKEALNNWDIYLRDVFEEYKKKTESKKKEFEEFLEHVEEIKKEAENATRYNVKQEEENLRGQLKDEEFTVKFYEKINQKE